MQKSKFSAALCCALFSLAAFTACSDDDTTTVGTDEVQETELKAITRQYIDATLHPTYAQLADSTAQLFDALHAIKLKLQNAPQTLTDADVAEACDIFIQARANYETSEAFLFGAATDFGIDPHIDTWPLDLQGLAVALNNTTQIREMDSYADGHAGDPAYYTGDAYAGNKLGPELLGFHGIEFIIFRNGAPRTAADLRGTDRYEGTALEGKYSVTGVNELIFATAVAGDLRNKCWQMEVSWNENAPADHRAKVEEDMEWPCSIAGTGLSYGQNFLLAGQPGSTYASVRKAVEAILEAGCASIADEVGNTKMGKPFTGEDKNYIESPFSERSLFDFYDNIMSIENSYMGGRPELRNESLSLHAYLQKYNADLDTRVTEAIRTAKARIQACPKPFVLYYNASQVEQAIAACNELDAALSEAAQWILRN